jgi:hypothetical protein
MPQDTAKAACVLAAVYRAPLGPVDFSVFLTGRTGTFKTALAAICHQHFGAAMDASRLPASFASTANALEEICFCAKDVLVVVDDFAPTGGIGDKELGSSISRVFGVTAFGFAGLSGVGYLTKRDLGPVGSFCPMGLFGLVGYGLLSMFFPSLMGARFVYSIVGIIVFAGLTAYDTQSIKAMNAPGSEGTDAARTTGIFGALQLYLDFINLFLSLLRITGRRQ